MSALTLLNPADGTVLRELPADDAVSVGAKIAAARAAQPAWAARPFAERRAIITRFCDLLIERKDTLALTTTAETGKPVRQARNEIAATPARVDFFVEHTAALLAPRLMHRQPDAGVPGAAALEEIVTFDPLGVVANISAWNYPWFVGTNVIVPALLCGNAVIYKPSEHATLTGLAIAGLLHEAGVPDDVFVPVVGAGDTGAALLEHPLDGVFFTGSYATGVKVAAAAARHLAPVQLELGGKDAAYVTDEVDPAAVAAAVADGAFYNAGQSCCAVERVYVHEAVYEPFVEAFVEAVRGFVMGPPTDEGTYIGPLCRAPQLAVLQAQVEDALHKGATLRCGGHRADRAGWYFEPTVLTEVDHTMAVMREESFGPIIGIERVADDAEAIARMNDTAYGLTAAVYGRDRARAARILERMNTGTVYWNCCDRVSPNLPWSGRGHSGVGATLSTEGIRAFLRPRAWHLRAP